MNKKDKTKNENVNINNNSQKEEEQNTSEHQKISEKELDKENLNINNDKTEDVAKDEDSNESLIEKLKDELSEAKDEKLRFLAEMENLRKRSERDRVDSIRYGSINLARDILSLNDNLSRALDAIPEEEKNSETFKNLTDGLKMVQRDFSTILEKHGVKKIDALNKKFDHNFHQAMMEVENNDVEEGTVVQEVQSGYTMHDRLLRAAMVGVSKKPVAKKEEPKEEKEEDNPDNESKEKS